jgi:hypothetical protein
MRPQHLRDEVARACYNRGWGTWTFRPLARPYGACTPLGLSSAPAVTAGGEVRHHGADVDTDRRDEVRPLRSRTHSGTVTVIGWSMKPIFVSLVGGG